MRYFIRTCSILLFAISLSAAAREPLPVPHMKRAEPSVAKAGSVVKVFGEHLDKSRVTAAYFTDGKNDIAVKILEQAEGFVKIEVPAKIEPGRYAVMVLLADAEPTLLEQPVSVTIE